MLISMKKFMQDESGATAIEYALLASVIAVALVAAAQAFGGALIAAFGRMTGAVAGF